MKMFAKLALMAMMVSATAARAGNEGAAGGDGIIDNGKVYLFDLYEMGIHDDIVVPENYRHVASYKWVHDRIKLKFRSLLNDTEEEPIVDILTIKVLQVANKSQALAYHILTAMTAYQWSKVPGLLLDVNDGDTVLNVDKSLLVQLATRKSTVIRISELNWDKLNINNRAALIMHEMLYAIQSSRNSSRARDLNGYLFSEGFEDDDRTALVSSYSPLYRTQSLIFANPDGHTVSNLMDFQVSGVNCKTQEFDGNKTAFLSESQYIFEPFYSTANHISVSQYSISYNFLQGGSDQFVQELTSISTRFDDLKLTLDAFDANVFATRLFKGIKPIFDLSEVAQQ